MNTTEIIVKSLEKLGIGAWILTDVTEETAELFFVKKQLDTRRIKDTHKYKVTVYRDETQGETKLRGCTDTEILSSDTAEEIEKKLTDAYFAAQFAYNPYYDLPDAVQAPLVEKTGALAEVPLAESAGKMIEALFAPDNRPDAFLNSAEIFVIRNLTAIRTSEGTDVSYTSAKVKGEYVVQCLEPEDVEMYHSFAYDECDAEALTKQVAESLDFVVDRAKAQKILKSGKYDLILCGEQLAEVLTYYGQRSHAQMLVSHYSTWKPGDAVQGETVTGEKLDLTFCATRPYNDEGIPMKDMSLIREGKLENIHGSTQFCRYLGVAPTGTYSKLRCENAGTESFADMKKKPCLWAVTFSDFQMDAMSGHFGGEIRLAYLIDGEKAVPVTGGSINGSILESQADLAFSTDRFTASNYEGPYAVKMKDISVAGCD